MTKAFIIAGTNSSVGKTTVATGIMKALVQRGMKVNSFKTGPDYIDCAYHQRIHGGQARNLDCWLTGQDKIAEVFSRGAAGADACVIEGVMGLFDGPRDGSCGSTADIAKLLDVPVVLVVNCQAVGQSMAATVKGFIEFDPEVHIAGLILNKVGSHSHYELIKDAIAKITDIPVLGCLPKEQQFHIPERHLGLTPSFEQLELERYFNNLGQLVENNLDIDQLLGLGKDVSSTKSANNIIELSSLIIGYAYDEAFNFYYQETLEELEARGCKLVPFSPLRDEALPEGIAGLIIGGGFPEMFLEDLTDNVTLRNQLRESISEGLPVYAECGGYMYLCEQIIAPNGDVHPMVGAIPGRCQMTGKLQSLGYTEYILTQDTIIGSSGSRFRGHEFHYSKIDPAWEQPCQVRKLRTNKGYQDGFASSSLFASYTHLNWLGHPQAATTFIERCQNYRKRWA